MSSLTTPIRTAVYYPFPFVKDDAWLKLAALFWDSIYRLIPEGFQYMEDFEDHRIADHSAVARALVDECQFVRDYKLPFSPPVFGDTNATAHAGAGLAELMQQEPELFRNSPGSQYFTWGLHEYYKSGMDDLTATLRSLGAFVDDSAQARPYRHGMFKFREFPGRVYMALLARYIGEKNGIPVVTDDAAHDRILRSDLLSSHKLRYELLDAAPVPWPEPVRRLGLPPTREPWELVLCTLTFSAVGVANLEDVPVRKIVKFRQNYDVERRAYFDEISAIVSTMQEAGAERQELLEAFLSERARQLSSTAESYGRVIRGMGLQTVYRLLEASFTMPVTELIGKYLQIDQPLSLAIAGAAGAVTISGVLHKTYLDRVKERLAKPTAFYLHQLRTRLI